ncbi:YidH family protein [Streptomyces caeni]|uniref:YidH family protein n=1 Tax=Streptomyces caeni TaxID=2307231 RepID=A0ABW4IQH7_9ACTN
MKPARLLSRLRDSQPPLYECGKDPDYRFSLANERTFLAWVRTSLALLGAGVAVIQFAPYFGIKGGRELLALILSGLSLMISVTAYGNWAAHERAMRLGDPLPAKSKMLRNVAVGLSIVSVLVLVLMAILISKKGG